LCIHQVYRSHMKDSPLKFNFGAPYSIGDVEYPEEWM
jgi:hypothetical protein